MTPDQIKATRMLASMFIDAVKEGGSRGAPAGVMYAAICDKITLSQFNQIMGALVRHKRLRQEGNLYFFVADL